MDDLSEKYYNLFKSLSVQRPGDYFGDAEYIDIVDDNIARLEYKDWVMMYHVILEVEGDSETDFRLNRVMEYIEYYELKMRRRGDYIPSYEEIREKILAENKRQVDEKRIYLDPPTLDGRLELLFLQAQFPNNSHIDHIKMLKLMAIFLNKNIYVINDPNNIGFHDDDNESDYEYQQLYDFIYYLVNSRRLTFQDFECNDPTFEQIFDEKNFVQVIREFRNNNYLQDDNQSCETFIDINVVTPYRMNRLMNLMIFLYLEKVEPTGVMEDITSAIGFLNQHFNNYFSIEKLSDVSLIDELLWALSEIDDSHLDFRKYPMEKISISGKGQERWEYLRKLKRFLIGCIKINRISSHEKFIKKELNNNEYEY